MSQYFVFLDVIPLPVTPEKIEISVPNLNKTVTMVDQGEINIIRGKGLKEIKFDMLVPSFKYPFANYSFGSFSTSQVIARLEYLKEAGKPVYFIVTRCRAGKPAWWTNIRVSLEDFTITEDANNGTDVIISVNLKEYKDYSTKLAIVDKKPDGTVVAKFETPRTLVTSNIAPTVDAMLNTNVGQTVKKVVLDKGQTLYNMMKTKLGKTDMSLLEKVKEANNNLKNVIEQVTEVKIDVEL